MPMITDPKTIELAEEFERNSGMIEEQELDGVEQSTLLLINHMFPRDTIFRATTVAFATLYSGCVASTELLSKLLGGFKVVAEAIEEDPRYLPNVFKKAREDQKDA